MPRATAAPHGIFAKMSRERIANQRGAMLAWIISHDIDVAAASSLSAQLPAEGNDYDALTPRELATKVVKLHRIGLNASRLTDKYKASLAEDDRAREQRQADILAMRGA